MYNNLYQQIFGPLDKGACLYFYALTFFFFFLLILTLFTELIYFYKHYKSLNSTMFTKGVLIVCNLFLAYFVNRLMYTMCVKSLM